MKPSEVICARALNCCVERNSRKPNSKNRKALEATADQPINVNIDTKTQQPAPTQADPPQTETQTAKTPLTYSKHQSQIRLKSALHMKKNYKREVGDLNLKPCKKIPFQNGELSEHKYLLVKNIQRDYGQEKEGLAIESLTDYTEIKQQRPKSSNFVQ